MPSKILQIKNPNRSIAEYTELLLMYFRQHATRGTFIACDFLRPLNPDTEPMIIYIRQQYFPLVERFKAQLIVIDETVHVITTDRQLTQETLDALVGVNEPLQYNT